MSTLNILHSKSFEITNLYDMAEPISAEQIKSAYNKIKDKPVSGMKALAKEWAILFAAYNERNEYPLNHRCISCYPTVFKYIGKLIENNMHYRPIQHHHARLY